MRWRRRRLPVPCSPLPGTQQGPQRPLAGTGLAWRGHRWTVRAEWVERDGRWRGEKSRAGRREGRAGPCISENNALWSPVQPLLLPTGWILPLGQGASRFLQTQPSPCLKIGALFEVRDCPWQVITSTACSSPGAQSASREGREAGAPRSLCRDGCCRPAGKGRGRTNIFSCMFGPAKPLLSQRELQCRLWPLGPSPLDRTGRSCSCHFAPLPFRELVRGLGQRSRPLLRPLLLHTG